MRRRKNIENKIPTSSQDTKNNFSLRHFFLISQMNLCSVLMNKLLFSSSPKFERLVPSKIFNSFFQFVQTVVNIEDSVNNPTCIYMNPNLLNLNRHKAKKKKDMWWSACEGGAICCAFAAAPPFQTALIWQYFSCLFNFDPKRHKFQRGFTKASILVLHYNYSQQWRSFCSIPWW